ncbi:MAG: heavy metal translocating P-type ATPase [Clostridia bacterium]|nr:heavy metal translocating P-type ATPase [Clostridia bacterium]
MEQYTVTGMSCAACSARVEKAVGSVSGVTSCSVNLLTHSMVVEGTASPSSIIQAVEAAGYGAAQKGAPKEGAKEDPFADRETPRLRKRLIASLVFLILLMYVSMGHSMWGWPLPSFFDGNFIAIGLLQLLLSAIVMVINKDFFISGTKALISRAPNMDTLVSLGSGASFIYSTVCLFLMTDAQLHGDTHAVHAYMHEFYFESAAMILALITVGKMLEALSKGKTTNALKSLMDLAPKTAIVLRDGVETEIPADQVKKGDIFIVKPGGAVPADGEIVEGFCAINESALTGESIPVDKTVGDNISAATVNQSGYIRCRATNVGEDTALSRIIQMVSDSAASKAPIAKVADTVSGVFVPAVISIAVLTIIIWLLCGSAFGFALARGISVLVISCPCALGLATPVAIMVGNGVGAKNGILFKNSVALEEAGRIRIVALDKTGTITEGKPVVTDIIPLGETDETTLLSLAYALESKSEHPLAKAIVAKAEELSLSLTDTENFTAVPGNGLTAEISGETVSGGNLAFLSRKLTVPQEAENAAKALAKQGKTPLYFAKGECLLGVIAVADRIKEDSPEAIRELKQMGIRVIMLTGDNKQTANAVKEQTGVDEVIAGVLPDGKEEIIRKYQKEGKVAMVGDGINDAPALTSADIGIAIGAGTDVAVESSDIVLMKNSLRDVPAALRLSRGTLHNIHENLFWAFIYNVIGIPLAAGVWIPLFGLTLNPMFGAAAMSLSSFCVVTNALRLNLLNVYSNKKDKPIRQKKEAKSMEKTLKIEGMMCPHCEARVKKVLEELDGVENVVPSHESGTAVITLSKDVDDALLTKTVEDQGYKVIG